MKQHINLDQYGELSENARNKLLKWLGGRDHFLNIGIMIEFLDEQFPHWGIYPSYHDNTECDKCGNRIRDLRGRKLYIVWGNKIETKQPSDVWGAEVELCDALWKAVKEVLNSQEDVKSP